MHTGKMSCNNEGRDQADPSQAKEHQRLPSKHQKQGERHKADSSSQASEETNPMDTLN